MHMLKRSQAMHTVCNKFKHLNMWDISSDDHSEMKLITEEKQKSLQIGGNYSSEPLNNK